MLKLWISRDHQLESVGFILVKFDSHFITRLVKRPTHSLPLEQLSVEGLGEADGGFIKDCFSLFAADYMRYVALLEDLAHKV